MSISFQWSYFCFILRAKINPVQEKEVDVQAETNEMVRITLKKILQDTGISNNVL